MSGTFVQFCLLTLFNHIKAAIFGSRIMVVYQLSGEGLRYISSNGTFLS